MSTKASVHPVQAVPSPEPATRQCGRCRQHFPAEPDMHPMALREWWACESCHDVLFGKAAFGRTAAGT